MKPQKHFPKKQLDLVVLVKYAVKVILEAGKCTTSTNRRLQHAIRPRPKNWNLASLPPLGTLRGSSEGPLKLSKSHLSHLHSQDATAKFWPLLDKDTCNGKKTISTVQPCGKMPAPLDFVYTQKVMLTRNISNFQEPVSSSASNLVDS